MSESELHDNCQIHLVYVGKDSYGVLHHKPFEDAAAPLSVKNMMLEPMKLCKIPKGQCQMEPWDLSGYRLDISADVSIDVLESENPDDNNPNVPTCNAESLDVELTNTE